ncbi:MAG: hypothetical protein ABWZ76_11550 [Acidimicrobiales bacterium]
MNASPAHDGPITRGHLEAKLRELQGGVEETKESAASMLLTVGALVVVGVITIAFLAGRRKGRKRTTVVEVRRI